MPPYKPVELMKNSDADRDAWLQMRCSYINSTESSALFGLSKYQSYFELWFSKKLELIDFSDNERMKAGRWLEPSIAKYALDELECHGVPFKQYLRHPDVLLASSFDWRVTNGKYKKWHVEIKNVDQWVFKDDWTYKEQGFIDEAPAHIETQVQHQMAVSGRPGTIIVGLVGGNKLIMIFRERDDAMCDMILNATNDFWVTQEDNIEPSPDFEIDADFLCQIKRKSGGDPFIATGSDPIAKLIDEDDTLKAAKNKIDKRRKEIKAEAFTLIGDADQIVIDGKKRRATTNVADKVDSSVTEDMVGDIIKGRKGYRNFR